MKKRETFLTESLLDRAETYLSGHVGPREAVPVQQMMYVLGTDYPQAAHAVVVALRQRRGLPIISSRDSRAPGYYMAESDEDRARGKNFFRHQATVSALNAAIISGATLSDVFIEIIAQIHDPKTNLAKEVARAFGNIRALDGSLHDFSLRLLNKLLRGKGPQRERNLKTLRSMFEKAGEVVEPKRLRELRRKEAALEGMTRELREKALKLEEQERALAEREKVLAQIENLVKSLHGRKAG